MLRIVVTRTVVLTYSATERPPPADSPPNSTTRSRGVIAAGVAHSRTNVRATVGFWKPTRRAMAAPTAGATTIFRAVAVPVRESAAP
jgi:hypothetical protein